MEAARTEAALAEAEAGLRRHPDDRSLLDLKAEVFSRLWPTDARFIEPAQTYFSFRLRCIERDCETLLELMKIHATKQTPELSWEFIELNLDKGRSRLRAISEAAGVGLADWQSGLAAVANYRLFRERYPVGEYCEALRQQGLAPDAGLAAGVGVALLPVFGRALVRFTECAKNKDRKQAVAVGEELGRQVAQIMAWFGTDWLATTMPEAKDERIDRLSRGVIAVPDIAVMEASRLFAVIGLHQGLVIKKLSKLIKWGDIHVHCMELLLGRVIEKWQMRKAPEGGKSAGGPEDRPSLPLSVPAQGIHRARGCEKRGKQNLHRCYRRLEFLQRQLRPLAKLRRADGYKELSQETVITQTGTEVILVPARHVAGPNNRVLIERDGALISAEQFAELHFTAKGYQVIRSESRPFHALFGVYMFLLIQDPSDPRNRMVMFGSRTASDTKTRLRPPALPCLGNATDDELQTFEPADLISLGACDRASLAHSSKCQFKRMQARGSGRPRQSIFYRDIFHSDQDARATDNRAS